ncbi:MAG: RnfABCDGE type electron transport complex subunit B, partial [Desulfarculaceae bacterium]
MIVEALAIGGLGLAAALGLGVAARVFYVEVDPLVEAVEENLPGANCGGCGFPGCSGAAEAIASGKAPPSICVGGGPEVQAAVAAIMGVEITETEPQIAQVGCRYPVQRADVKYNYSGLNDCRSAVLMAGGPKECPVGCIGLGSCVKACPFDALSISPEGLPVVDEYKCTGCGTCVRTCPVGIMQLTSVSDRILAEYTTDECTAPCQRSCPAGINIPEQIRQTALGNYDMALMVIKERNPLPLVCGRICPHPCELACRRNLSDEPVAINPLKRFVSDHERSSGKRLMPYRAPATGRKVAVIGGGAEGLSAGWFLARLGHSPAIYEALPKLGGLLRTVIPPSRLPREVLDWEIEGILEMGVTANTGQALGKDFSIASLFDESYEAVLLATGGWDSMLLRSDTPDPAPGLPGLYLLLPLNLAWAMGQK